MFIWVPREASSARLLPFLGNGVIFCERTANENEPFYCGRVTKLLRSVFVHMLVIANVLF